MPKLLRKNQVVEREDLLRRYATILCRAYDALFELNLTRESVQTVFYTRHKYRNFQNFGSGAEGLAQCAELSIYETERPAFLEFLSARNLEQVYQGGGTSRLEFRERQEEGRFLWVQAVLLPVDTEERVLLCALWDVDLQKQEQEKNNALQLENDALAQTVFQTFGSIYFNMVLLDLDTDMALLLKGDGLPTGRHYCWSRLLEHCLFLWVSTSDREFIREQVSLRGLSALLESGQTTKTLEARCRVNNQGYDWAEISAFSIAGEGRKFLLTTRSVGKERLVGQLVDQLVYQQCDYFIRVDGTKDSYTMFHWKESGTPLLPVRGSYTGQTARYWKAHVAHEDLALVQRELQLSRVLQVLEQRGEHVVTLGVLEPERGYTRKRIQCIYNDQPSQSFLLICTDITAVYLEETKQNDLLRAALAEARTDALTGLYNQRAVGELVDLALVARPSAPAALLFVDLDNFKQVNDTVGHAGGDRLLRYVAESLQATVGANDLVGRVGGDEFIVFLATLQGQKSAERVAEQICSIFGRYREDLRGVGVSCSVGIAHYPVSGMDYKTLAERADLALYHAKGLGKGRYQSFDQDVVNIL